MRRTTNPFKGLTARSCGIFGNYDETYTFQETYNDGIAVIWSGLLQNGLEAKELFGRILPPGMPVIYPTHRGHGTPDEYSDGIISFPGIREDIQKVLYLTGKMGFRKRIKVYNSISCPAGLAELIESANYDDSVKNKIPRQDATIFISPPDHVRDYLPRSIRKGCDIARSKIIPRWFANLYYASLVAVARKMFEQMGDGVTRTRYMDIQHDTEKILLGLDSFPRISELYAGHGNELEGDSILVIYGLHDGIIPQEDFHKFIETLKRRGADVKVVPMNSGHRVTAPNGSADPRSLDVEVDEGKVTDLNGIVSRWLYENSIFKPCGEEDLMDMTKSAEKYSDISKAEFYISYPKRYPEDDGLTLRIT
jgi:hypothetical protein